MNAVMKEFLDSTIGEYRRNYGPPSINPSEGMGKGGGDSNKMWGVAHPAFSWRTHPHQEGEIRVGAE